MIIGVSEYQNLPKKSWLLSSHKDAQALADFLQSPRGGSLPQAHLKSLLNRDATTRNIRVALDSVISKSQPGDVVYFFFAGHGKVRTLGGGDAAYLLPFDAEPEFLNATALPMEELHRCLLYTSPSPRDRG